MKRTIKNYKMRRYLVLYSWCSIKEKHFGKIVIEAKTKKAVYARLGYDSLFNYRNVKYAGTVQVEKVTWIRPPKPEDEENG